MISLKEFNDFEKVKIPSNELKSVGGGASTTWTPGATSMEMTDSIADCGYTTYFSCGDGNMD